MCDDLVDADCLESFFNCLCCCFLCGALCSCCMNNKRDPVVMTQPASTVVYSTGPQVGYPSYQPVTYAPGGYPTAQTVESSVTYTSNMPPGYPPSQPYPMVNSTVTYGPNYGPQAPPPMGYNQMAYPASAPAYPPPYPTQL